MRQQINFHLVFPVQRFHFFYSYAKAIHVISVFCVQLSSKWKITIYTSDSNIKCLPEGQSQLSISFKEWLPRMPSTTTAHQWLFSFPLVSSINLPYIVNSNLFILKLLFIIERNMFSWFSWYICLSVRIVSVSVVKIEYTMIFFIEIMETFFYLITFHVTARFLGWNEKCFILVIKWEFSMCLMNEQVHECHRKREFQDRERGLLLPPMGRIHKWYILFFPVFHFSLLVVIWEMFSHSILWNLR